MRHTLLLALAAAGLLTTAGAATLEFSALIGGGTDYNMESAHDVAVDKDGFIFVVGESNSADFPAVTSFGDPTYGEKCFVLKLSPDGSQTLYSTVLRGGRGRAIAVDSQGQAYITGETARPEFFLLSPVQPAIGGDHDAFVAKLDSSGQLVFSTFFGGSNLEMGLGIALDAVNNICVTGFTASSDLPVTDSAAKKSLSGKHDAFVVKLSNDGKVRLLSSYVGGSERETATAIAVGSNGDIYLAGQSNSEEFEGGPSRKYGSNGTANAFVARLQPSTAALEFVAFLGGTAAEIASALVLDKEGNIFVTGDTGSSDFPVIPMSAQAAADGYNCFVAKLNPSGQALLYATYLPGSVSITLGWPLEGHPFAKSGLAVNELGEAYVGSSAVHTLFLPRGEAISWGGLRWGTDALISRLNREGTEIIQTLFLGGGNYDSCHALALAGPGTVVMAGLTTFSSLPPFFPTTGNAFNRKYAGSDAEAFIAKISFSGSIPANDNMASAKALTGSILTEAAENTKATAEAAEPAHAGQPASHSLWWKWTAPATGFLTLDTLGSTFDTLLSVYSPNAGGSLLSLAENDDVGREPHNAASLHKSAHVKMAVENGRSYSMAIDGKNGATGQILLSFIFSSALNDDLTSATPISGYAVFTGSNLNSSSGLLEPQFYLSRNSVWWKWIAPKTEGVSISTIGSATSARLGVYSGTSLRDLAQKVEPEQESLTFLAESGQNYVIMVDSRWGETGDIRLEIKPVEPPPNDNFLKATSLSGSMVEVAGSNINATPEPGEEKLPHAASAAGRTVWWKWMAATNGWVSVDTKVNARQTLVTVFHGQSLDSLSFVAGCDANCSLTFRVQQDSIYYVRVDTVVWDMRGEFNLKLQFTQPPEIDLSTAHFSLNGTYEFAARGVPGRSYKVQSTPNLSPLQDWATLPLGPYSGVSFTVTIPLGPGRASQFFRLQEQP